MMCKASSNRQLSFPGELLHDRLSTSQPELGRHLDSWACLPCSMLCKLIATAAALRIKCRQLMAPAALLAEALWPATPVQRHNNVIKFNACRPNPHKSCINTQRPSHCP